MRVVSGDARGLAASVARGALSVMSGFYLAGVSLRRAAYDIGIAPVGRPVGRVDARIVSIGNITAGGTGKTPATIYYARKYLDEGLRTTVLSRGYGRTGPENTPLAVSDGNRILVSPEESGDEPYLISKKLPGVPVVVCGKRVRGAEFAIAEFGAQVIVLDDGFQHAAIARDEDIVLIDCTNPFGFGRLLPRGLLREPPGALKRATRFILTRADECDHTETVRTLAAANPAAEILRSRHRPVGLSTLDGARREAPGSISGKKALAVSSIGNPAAFESTLRRLGADIVRSMRFRDHHRYAAVDVGDIERAADKCGADCIVSTEKDGVRLAMVPSAPGDLLLLDVELELIE